jgi:hypothetical protein
MRDQLHYLFATLRFQGMAQTLDRELDRAEQEASRLKRSSTIS